MSTSRRQPPSQTELPATDENPHYVRSVTETGEYNEIVAQEDIYAANGMKLLVRGAKINRSKWERLSAHKLARPLDLLLSASDTVDPVSLARDMDRALTGEPLLSAVNMRSGDVHGWKALLGRLSLPGPLAFRLTVMRDNRNDIYQHSLRVAVAAHAIGARLGLSEEAARHLLLAALCHDIGEMHTDPKLLATGRRIASEEYRFIRVHPVTGFVVLKQIEEVPGEVMQGVLQHHERIDGSGYPHGITGECLCLPARIIAVAEIFDTVGRRFGIDRLRVAIRLNHARFDPAILEALRDLLPVATGSDGDTASAPPLEDRIMRLNAVFDGWPALRGKLAQDYSCNALAFIGERMAVLQSLTFQAGLTPRFLTLLDLGGDDAGVVHELSAALDEILRRFDDLAFEIERRIASGDPAYALAQRVLNLMRWGTAVG